MADEVIFNELALRVWQTVREHGPITVRDIAARNQLDQAFVAAVEAKAMLQEHFDVEPIDYYELSVSGDSAQKYQDEMLPERRAAIRLQHEPDGMPMDRFVEWCKTENLAVNEVLKWGGAKKWIERSKTASGLSVVLTQIGKTELSKPTLDELAIESAIKHGGLVALVEPEFDPNSVDRIVALLGKRSEIAKVKKRTDRRLRITKKGEELLDSGRIKLERLCNAITHEDLVSGAALTNRYRPYDVNLDADIVYPAKIHPLRKIIEETRRAFLEMGFAEVVSPMVESAFWNFDALFQPQDHPAREMQDTFYMRYPAEAPLPDAKIVDQVRRTHEDGWETGSEGWGYTWSPERSKQVVLRTHTTAATIRALAKNPNPPGKFFCVGWTYRNETISFKHLPVFHQVDGIIIDEEANLASLMGTLQEFYSKMGFGRVKFKPAFYPYTEPSVDVVVYMESRGKWLEMGGAGIFRPEVTLPLGCKQPVLAWGLGIERLAMLRFGLDDIRELYRPNLDALEGVPLCR